MRRKFAALIRCLRRCDAGAAAVEFALVVLPMILLALGTFDYFGASYALTTLAGAARGVGEYAWQASVCAGGLANPSCSPGMSSLFGTMQSNNNLLSGAALGTPTEYYTCVDNTQLSTSPPTCDVNGDTRVIAYIEVTVTDGWWKLFAWDPWSSTSPLLGRMFMRIQ